MCMYVHVCAVHTQPLAPPVCVWAIPAPPPTPFSRGEGTEGNQRGNRRGREPGVLIQTHRRARRGGHEVTRHLHHTQTPAPSLAAAVATATRGAQSIPGYCQPLLLPLCCRGPGCPREREKCRDCPCHSDPPKSAGCTHGRAPSTARGLGSTTWGSNVPVWCHCRPLQWDLSLRRGTAGSKGNHGAATVRAHWPSPLPPDLSKGQGHTRLLSNVAHTDTCTHCHWPGSESHVAGLPQRCHILPSLFLTPWVSLPKGSKPVEKMALGEATGN